MGSADEVVIIVDKENNEIGALPRHEMRAGRLPHRATYILVFNSGGDLYVQKRTQTKDVFPGYYDVAAGGVVLAGESYEEGAGRELEEELGIRGTPLETLFDFFYENEYIRLWGRAFSCVYDGNLVLQEEEIESGRFMKVDEILQLAETEPFTPDCLYVLQRYLGARMQGPDSALALPKNFNVGHRRTQSCLFHTAVTIGTADSFKICVLMYRGRGLEVAGA